MHSILKLYAAIEIWYTTAQINEWTNGWTSERIMWMMGEVQERWEQPRVAISIFQFEVRWPFEMSIKGFRHLCIDNNAAIVETSLSTSALCSVSLLFPPNVFLSGNNPCILRCDIAASVWQIPNAWMKHVTIVNEMQLEMFFNPKTFLNIIIVYEITMNGSQWNTYVYAVFDACQV